MLLDLAELIVKYDMKINGVLHIGAHLAEEAPIYAAAGIENVWWVEANPDVIGKVRAAANRPEQVIKALVLDHPPRTEVRFNVTNYDGMSSSVYNWGTHTSFSPDTVIDHTIYLTSTTLDALQWNFEIKDVNMLNIDVEGANLDVLTGGATRVLPEIDYIYVEVQIDNVYDGAPLLGTVDNWLALSGFGRVELGLVEGQGWGDALYIRRSLI